MITQKRKFQEYVEDERKHKRLAFEQYLEQVQEKRQWTHAVDQFLILPDLLSAPSTRKIWVVHQVSHLHKIGYWRLNNEILGIFTNLLPAQQLLIRLQLQELNDHGDEPLQNYPLMNYQFIDLLPFPTVLTNLVLEYCDPQTEFMKELDTTCENLSHKEDGYEHTRHWLTCCTLQGEDKYIKKKLTS